MAITESKNKNGTLKLGTSPSQKSFETQATNVRVTPSYEDVGDPIETLSGDALTASKQRTDALNIIAVQDFTDPTGFVNYSWDNDLTTVDFEWAPNGPTGPKWAGKVEILAVEVGGDVNTRLTTEVEWTCVGAVTRTDPTTPFAD